MKAAKTVCCALGVGLLAACSAPEPRIGRQVVLITPPADLQPPASVPAPAPAPAPVPPPAPAPEPIAAPAPPPAAAPPAAPDVIYFRPDAYKFDERYRPVLQAHAKKLKTSPELHLVIQAYADSRGASDYNLALSKKRAETVAKALVTEGAAAEQLELVYHGERVRRGERLAATDRRVELQYRMP